MAYTSETTRNKHSSPAGTHQWLVCGRKAGWKRRNLDGGSKAKNHRQGKNCCMKAAKQERARLELLAHYHVWLACQETIIMQGAHEKSTFNNGEIHAAAKSIFKDMPRSLQLMTHTALAAPHAPRLKKSPTRPDIRSTAGLQNCPRNIKCSAVNPKTKHPFMVILKILHYRLHHSISYNIRNPLASWGVARRNAAASGCCDTSGYRLVSWWTILHDCMLQIVIGYRYIPQNPQIGMTRKKNRPFEMGDPVVWGSPFEETPDMRQAAVVF